MGLLQRVINFVIQRKGVFAMNDIEKNAEEKAFQIIDNLFDLDDRIQNEKFVIPLGEVAEQLGIKTLLIDFQEEFKEKPEFAASLKKNKVEGFALRDTKVIFIDTKSTPGRQRFTVAHEIGHIELNHLESGEFSIACRDSMSSPSKANQEEIEANAFAAALLMPEPLVRRAHKITRDVYNLAIYFGVSRQAMERRLKRLGLS